MRTLFLLICAVSLSNCLAVVAVPPALQYASTAATIISYLTTGKGTSDHVISAVTDQDCALHRVVLSSEICRPKNIQTANVVLGNQITPLTFAFDPEADNVTAVFHLDKLDIFPTQVLGFRRSHAGVAHDQQPVMQQHPL